MIDFIKGKVYQYRAVFKNYEELLSRIYSQRQYLVGVCPADEPDPPYVGRIYQANEITFNTEPVAAPFRCVAQTGIEDMREQFAVSFRGHEFDYAEYADSLFFRFESD